MSGELIVVDNFTLEQYEVCPRKGHFRIELARVPKKQSSALNFGVVFHEGLATWYKTGSAKSALERMNEVWPEGIVPEDHRTKERCLSVFAQYVQEYGREGFSVVGYPDAPMVEVAFTIDTGLGFSYGGIMDLVVERNNELYVVDHKTTSQLGGQFFLQFKPNNQISGYVWGASQLTNRRVSGAMINAIGVLKSETKFERGWITRTPADIQEWIQDVAEAVEEIKRARKTGFFRKRTTGCVTRYGRCMYHDVCSLADDKTRQRFLEQEFDVSTWSHEKRDAEG